MSVRTKGKLIFIIEDEHDIAELIRYSLTTESYNTECFHSGEDGITALQQQKPDLILLDLMLPAMNGIEVCRKIKENSATNAIPVVMLTAKGEESDVVLGLEIGADDYITKPFSPKVLLARVAAILRRTATTEKSVEDVLNVGELSIHPGRHEASVSGNKLDLTRSEFQILHKLARKPGWVFTRAQIVEAIHGDNFTVTDRTIDFQMVGLRKKLGSMANYIETVRGVGYKFKE